MLTQETLDEALRCNEHTGKISWLISPGNQVHIGDEAGYINLDGYREIRLYGKCYLAHRLMYLHMIGEFPEMMDHINGDRSDNRWCNLRKTTRLENAHNACMQKNNTSGITGVHWPKNRKKCRARIYRNGKQIHLGYFGTGAEGEAAVRLAYKEYDYSDRHGL